MMPPHNRSVKQLARQEKISENTLHKWRKEARAKGMLMPDGDVGPEGWNAREKFAAVMESASFNEHETAEYCRRKGIYPHQLKQWRKACENANDWDREAEQWTVPLQINVGKTVMWNGRPWKLPVELNYYVEKADGF